jgi:hypothetical protein
VVGVAAAVVVTSLSDKGGSDGDARPRAGVPRVYPLTGLPVTDAATALRPALSVKIDNSAAAHPQAGVGDADLVSEQLVEGGLTRLLVTFHSNDAARVGPIRSARPVDAGLLRQVGGGIFAFSGAAAGSLAPVRAESGATLLSEDAFAGRPDSPFSRSSARPAPYNVYSTTTKLYATGLARGAARRPPPQIFTSAAAVPAGARPVATATMSFSPASARAWRWDPSARAWLRSENGRADRDDTGAQLAATNVVVLQVTTRDIPGLVDTAGSPVQDIRLTGSGRAWVLRDGAVTGGRWSRPSLADVGRLTDDTGRVMPLRPGQTWLELLPSPNAPRFG